MSLQIGQRNIIDMGQKSERKLSQLSSHVYGGEEPCKMTPLAHRLLILPFLTGHHHDTLKNLAAGLTCGILIKLQLLSEQDVRILHLDHSALHHEHGNIDSIWTEERLLQIAQQEQSRFILTGALDLITSGKHRRLVIHFRLYDALKERFVVNDASSIERCLLSQLNLADKVRSVFSKKMESACAQIIIPANDLNQSIDWMVLYALASTTATALDLKSIASSLGEPITQSIEALFAFAEGEALCSQHIHEKIDWYESAINIDPSFEMAYKRLGALYKALREFDKSLQNYKRAFEHSRAQCKTKAKYANEIGICYALRQDYGSAIDYWKKATALHQGFVIAYLNIAHAYETLNDFHKAAEAFEQAKEIAPNDSRLWINLARIYSKLDRWQDALSAYMKQLSFNTADPWCHSNIANCYLQLGNQAQARKHYEAVTALQPNGEAADFANLVLYQLSVTSA